MINFIMNNGLDIPAIGYGVFMMSSVEIEQHLPEAIETGYRHIDTANAYFNEVAVGKVIKESGIAREDFFITSLLRNCSHKAMNTNSARKILTQRLNVCSWIIST